MNEDYDDYYYVEVGDCGKHDDVATHDDDDDYDVDEKRLKVSPLTLYLQIDT